MQEQYNPQKETNAIDFSIKLQALLSTELTPENVSSFYETSFTELVNLNTDIVSAYQSTFRASDLQGKDLEDAAYEYFRVMGLEQVLIKLQSVQERLEQIDLLIEFKLQQTQQLILPPSNGEEIITGSGEGWEQAGIVNRLQLLMYILQSDLEINAGEVTIEVGVVAPNQVRQTSYYIVTIPSLNRMVFISNEEGNATFIVNTKVTEQSEISLQSLAGLTKEQLNQMFDSVPGSGRKIRYTKNWKDYVIDSLSNDIVSSGKNSQTTQPSQEFSIDKDSLVKVATGELDPWRGFYADTSTGKHYSGKFNIASNLNISFSKVTTIITDYNISGILGKSIAGRPTTLYCLEEVKDYIEEWKALPQVITDKENEWYGFYFNEEDERYYGGKSNIEFRLGISVTTIDSIISDYDVNRVRGKNLQGMVITLYCLEEIDGFYRTLPQVITDKENEWCGFYFNEEDNKYYGGKDNIASKLNVSSRKVTSIIIEHNISGILGKNIQGLQITLYCLEEIEGYIAEWKALPQVITNENDEWFGFYLSEEDERYYGGKDNIASKLNVSPARVESIIIIKRNFSRIQGKDLHGRPITLHCLEEVNGYIEEWKALPQVIEDKGNEWFGFYLNDNDSRYYGGKHNIASKLNVSPNRVESIIIDHNISGIPGKSINGRLTTLYGLDEIKGYSTNWKALPQVIEDKGNEWCGFYFNEEERRYYGGKTNIASKLKLNLEKFNSIVSRYNINGIPGKDIQGKSITLYCLEEIEALLEAES